MASPDPEKTKARRATQLLYVIMAVFILLPLILFCIFR
jgi:hypothetical protein